MTLVNIKKYCRVSGKWTFLSIPKTKGRFQLGQVMLNGLPTKSPEGTFYIEWRENGKRIQHPVGRNARDAQDAATTRAAILRGEATEPEKTVAPKAGTTLLEATNSFMRDIRATKSPNTAKTYQISMDWFLETCEKEYVSEVTRDDIINLFSVGRQSGRAQRTINKHVTVILGALNRHGAAIKMKKGDKPKTTRHEVEVYTPDEMKKFFEHCDRGEHLLFKTFLHSGFRHMEVATREWPDLDWRRKLLYVRAKPHLDFHPKTYQERAVPVPQTLVDEMRAWHKEHADTTLMFPSREHPFRKDQAGGQVDTKMLRQCKAIALRAGLNCGMCKDPKIGPCIASPSCAHWYLHKFRHTFATNMLQSGVDIKTVQVLLGHAHLSTTELYLRAVRLEDLRDRVDAMPY